MGVMAGDGPNLLAMLDELAEARPDEPLYVELMDGIHESAHLTPATLRRRAAALALGVRRSGVAQGDVVLMVASSPCEFLVALFGCMWAGVVAAPVAFPRRPEHIASRLEPVRANAGAVAVVAGPPHGDAERAVLELLTAGDIPVVHTAVAPVDAATVPYVVNDIAYLQYTSGSTSDPRGVVMTHDNLTANLEVCRELMRLTPRSVSVSWCPLTHDMGLVMGALPGVAFGCRTVLMPPSAFIRSPLTWFRAMETHRGTHGCSPNFGYDLLVDRTTAEERAALDLSSVEVLINGAEPVRPETWERFLAAWAVAGLSEDAHCPAYGLAEATVLVSTAPQAGPGLALTVDAAALERHELVLSDCTAPGGARVIAADGVVGSSYDVRIVDPVSCEPCDPGTVGELWLRGPCVSPGYWRRDELTRQTFGATLADDDGGPYLRTGDLAVLHGDQIVICGRAKDVIVIRGRNIHPQDVELTVETAHAAVRRGGSAAFAIVDDREHEALVVVAEVDGDPDATAVTAAIRATILRDFELHVADVLLVGPQTVPKTSSGKKQRAATRALWRDAREAAAV